MNDETGAEGVLEDQLEAAGLDAGALTRLVRAVRADIDRGLHYGAVLLVARHGVVGLRAAIGHADRARERVTALDDRFLFMSLTKSVTAAAVLRRIDRGGLGFETRVAEIIPEFAQRGKARVTIAHLLTHTAGLGYGFNLPEELDPFGGPDLAAAAAAVAPLPVQARPGSRVSYTPWEGFATLGQVLVRLDQAGRPFRTILAEEVFQPLGMTDTTIGSAVDDPRRVAMSVVAPGSAAQPASALEAVNDFGADAEIPGVNGYGTGDDLNAFGQMILRRGRTTEGASFLSPAMVDFAYRVHTGERRNEFWDFNLEAADLPDFPANFTLAGGYGRGTGGIHLTPAGYTASPRTFAGVGGGTTMVLADPERDLSFVFLSSGAIEGMAHFIRLQRLADLALAAATD